MVTLFKSADVSDIADFFTPARVLFQVHLQVCTNPVQKKYSRRAENIRYICNIRTSSTMGSAPESPPIPEKAGDVQATSEKLSVMSCTQS